MHLSDAEWTVMRALWQGAPATAREIRERAPETGWAHTTVKTLLARLVEKGAVSERKQGRASVYTPRITASQARRTALRGLVDRAFGGTFGSLVQHLVREERLDEEERARLVEALAELERGEHEPTAPANQRSRRR